jgi:hypothetical protein
MSRTVAVFAFAVLVCACAPPEYEFQSEQAARAGVDYRRIAKRAHAGDESALLTLFRVTPSLDGGGAESHAAELHKLLASYGDARFASLLRRENPKVRQSVIDSLDFAFEVYVRHPHWSASFPITYAIAPHPVLRRSQKQT